MRLSLLALALLFAVPAQAQISFSPIVGYDLEAEGPMIGLAFEFATPIEGLPLQPAIRPLVEYVFLDAPDNVTFNLVRAQADLIARFETSPGASFLPYAKAGIGIEYFSTDRDGGEFGNSDTDLALNIGGGAEFSRFFLEGGLGLAGQEISDGLRIRAGYRF